LLGGKLMRGVGLATRTSSVNLASRRAASPGEGEGDSSSDSVVVPTKGVEDAPGTDNAGGSTMAGMLLNYLEYTRRDSRLL
jgi:hypothetical protein